MRWTVETVQEVSSIPPCIDSSLSEIIAVGLEAYDGRAGRPLVNSVAFERLDCLDMAVDHNARIMAMATSPDGMPDDDEERIENVRGIMEHITAKGVSLDDVFVDGIVLLISVDSRYGNHYFDAVRKLREIYGAGPAHRWRGSATSRSGCPSAGSSTRYSSTWPWRPA